MLRIVPHSFCQGEASDHRWNGQSIIKIHHEGWWLEKSSSFESYSSPNLVAMPPEQIFDEIQRYRCNWPFKQLYHLSENAVQTEGSCEDHPHAQALEKFFPDFMQTFGPVMPRYYPHPVVLSKMRQEDADAKSEYYLKMWVAIEEAKKREHEHRSKLASAQHKDRNRRIKGDVIPAYYYTTAGDISSMKCLFAVQTVITAINQDQKDQCIQAEPPSDEAQLMPPEGKIGNGDTPDAMPEETEQQIHPEAEQIFLSEGIARYPLKIDGRTHLLSRVEYNVKFPGRSWTAHSMTTEARKSVDKQIKCRISKKFRLKEERIKLRSAMHPEGYKEEECPPLVRLKRNTTMSNLYDHFFKKFCQQGRVGLPMRSSDTDPDETDEEFKDKILKMNIQKPADYKLL